MAFSSVTFLFMFFPVFLLVYYFVPAGKRMYCILAGSMVFYYIGVRGYEWMMLFPVCGIILSYFAGLLVGKIKEEKPAQARLVVIASCVILFGALLFFKYAGVFIGRSLLLPVGLSFYTFQLTAYIFDVYRGKYEAEKRMDKFASVMFMFPKLISGPITPWKDLDETITAPECRKENIDDGLRTLIEGLVLKTLLADRVGGLWGQVTMMGFNGISTPLAWMAAISYSLKLYFDFAGYSLMAIGVAKMMGFILPENFRYPYVARSMSDFWRRWHITLGKWFTEYIYIPLGGSRKGMAFTIVNLFVVWLCTGVWHGSTWNFIIWAGFLFVIIAIEKLLKIAKNNSPFSHIYMIPAILVSWSVFAITNLRDLLTFMSKLFPFTGNYAGVMAQDYLVYGKRFGIILLIGILFSTPGPRKVWDKIRNKPAGTALLFVAFWVVVYCLAVGLNDPFMYFAF